MARRHGLWEDRGVISFILPAHDEAVLIGDTLMQDQPKPSGDPFQRAAEATAGRLLLHHPDAPTRAFPVVGKPEKVEALFAGVPRLLSSARRRTEVQQAGLGRV